MEITKEHLRCIQTLIEGVKRAQSGKPLTKEQSRLMDIIVGNHDKLPVYGSIESASGATGIPRPIFQGAKRAGCTAFQYGRVNLGDFLKFFFQHTDEIA